MRRHAAKHRFGTTLPSRNSGEIDAKCREKRLSRPPARYKNAVIRNGARMSFPMVRPLIAALLVAAAFGADAAAAPQNGTVKSTHGAWSIICDTPAGATSEQCAMMQNVVAEDRPEIGLSVVVLRTADNKAEILRVLAPLGVLLPNGLGLNVDGKDIGRAYFVRCFQDGCYAEVILEKQLLDTLKNGTSATFIVFQTPEEGIGIPVDLKGFAEGFAALP
jgi:invasion protein IalB